MPFSEGFNGVAQAGGVADGESVGIEVSVGEVVDVAMGGREVWVGAGCVAVTSTAVACGVQEIRRLASKKRFRDLFMLFTLSIKQVLKT